MAEIPAVMAVAAVETAIAAETVIPVPAETRIPVAHAVSKRTDAAGTEIGTADLPDRISRTLHRWMIRHFPEEMTEDVRPADVNRIPEIKDNRKAPELWIQFGG